MRRQSRLVVGCNHLRKYHQLDHIQNYCRIDRSSGTNRRHLSEPSTKPSDASKRKPVASNAKEIGEALEIDRDPIVLLLDDPVGYVVLPHRAYVS
jgi:hypothetical protein